MKTAIFPGSFDPFTIGHAAIVERGLSLFDRIVIGVGKNESKRSLYTAEERVRAISELYADNPQVKVVGYDDLTIDLARREGAQFILRGIRSVKDFEYERDIANINERLAGIETVLLITDPQHASISSSVVRELIAFGKDVTEFLPQKKTRYFHGFTARTSRKFTQPSFYTRIMKRIFYILICLLASTSCAFAQNNRYGVTDLNQVQKIQIAEMAIANFYVDSVDQQKLAEAAIIGMLEELDPHSSYTNPEETKSLNEPLEGNFEGIGVQFNILEDTLVVIQPTTKGPSEKAGILAGDRIISVDGKPIAGVKMPRDSVMRILRGPKGTKVKLGVVRRGIKDVMYFVVTRDKIPVNTLDAAYMIAPGIGYIHLDRFGSTSGKEVSDAIEALKAQGMQRLIFRPAKQRRWLSRCRQRGGRAVPSHRFAHRLHRRQADTFATLFRRKERRFPRRRTGHPCE